MLPVRGNGERSHIRVPTEAEQAERRARHAKLDAIAAKLALLAQTKRVATPTGGLGSA